MRKLGLIGGVGPESTIAYYRLLIRQFQQELNTKNYPEILLHSINMTQMLSYVFTNQLDKLVDFLAARVSILEKAGAGFAAIASNTPHIVFDELRDRVNIPMISIVEETCKFMAQKNLKRVGLFGTKSTMTFGFYQRIAGKSGIAIVIPEAGKQDYIHEKYMTELVMNRIIPETKIQLLRIVQELQEKESIEGLILGGTELPLILNQSDVDGIEIFDTTRIHVDSIVKRILE